jgi:hypothetical protein
VKARSCRRAAGDSLAARRHDRGLALRDVNVREAEGAMERYWLVRAGARRAKREQRAIFASGASSRRSFKLGGVVRTVLGKGGQVV